MSTALFSWCDEKSTSWLYAGMAFNMIIDLGIHVDADTLRQRFSEDELEIRHRVFWAAYSIDKLLSLYQGRPSCLRESSTNLPMTFMDEHEELELFNPLTYTELVDYPISPVYSISTFRETCKLSIILEKILQCLYSEKSKSRDPNDLLQEAKTIHEELEKWRRSLPGHLDLMPTDPVTKKSLPHTLALIASFNVVIILLHRPFVSEGHLHFASSSIALNAFSVCSAAAFEIDYISRTYERSFCLKTTPYIISYAIYVSATIHVRLAIQRERGSDAHRALRRCLHVLEIHQAHCWSARRAKRVIEGLITHMGVVVDNGDFLGESSVLMSNINIDAIIRTFAREQPLAEAPTRHSPSNLEKGDARSGFSNSALQLPEMATSDHNLLNEQIMQMNGYDIGLQYDPIFGFNGSAFDYLNLPSGDDLL
ncbi:hypothetical protein BP5796_11533 [Coleophoma crateriformis]|uniref:Xylanolytic transcriptional activator regulatory domain-containing protein n=1 Tax=Coleophoma crateriformis TaxID=565419 RepID=A0A3D8QIU7_9HELO|nr:hypothetical protein BP5796_11533 [Coleophoma crateriformis]